MVPSYNFSLSETVNLCGKEFEGSEFGGHCSEVSLSA